MLEVVDFTFTVATTLILGALTFVQFFSDKKRSRFEEAQQRHDREEARKRQAFEDEQREKDRVEVENRQKFADTKTALDLHAAVSTSEIIRLLNSDELTKDEEDFLSNVHLVATRRLMAITERLKIEQSVVESVDEAVQRLLDVVGKFNPEAYDHQDLANKVSGSAIRTDRSIFSWDGASKLSKFDLMHVIAQKFIEREGITTREEFNTQWGGVLQALFGEHVDGKMFNPDKLLDELKPVGHRYYDRDQKLAREWGAIEFDGVEYRAGWEVGYGQVQAIGVTLQKPLIEHFRREPGYPIERL